jgi:hypothetical protein
VACSCLGGLCFLLFLVTAATINSNRTANQLGHTIFILLNYCVSVISSFFEKQLLGIILSKVKLHAMNNRDWFQHSFTAGRIYLCFAYCFMELLFSFLMWS